MTEAREQRMNQVLIVEDDDVQRMTLVDLLEHDGFRVTACATAAEALDQVRRQKFAVAVLDLKLPDLDGTRLAERIRDLNGDIRTIIHTAYGSFDSARDAVNFGVFGYVEKGGPPDKLIGHVHRAMRDQYVHYAHDLERAVAERTASLRESEQRFRVMAENSGVGIWHITAQRESIYANPTLLSMLEIEHAEDLRGQDITPFFTPESIARMDLEHEKRARGIASMYEVEMIGRRGKRTHAIVCGAPILNPQGRLTSMIGTFIDITERRQHEQARQALEEQLRQAQKLEAIGQLAGGVAHDFNNLLTVIQGNLELLRHSTGEAGPFDPATMQRLEQIELAAVRAAALTSQLLAFGRRQKVTPSVIELGRVVKEISTLLQTMIGEQATLDLALDPQAPRVRADRGMMEQVIMNLVVNARDAMHGRGRVSIRTGAQAMGPDQAGTAGLEPGDYVFLDVIDQGEGMAPQVLERIFEPFFTTKGPTRGTGLGLSTVYGIVKQAGGHIMVESQAGQGSRFRVLLPACRDEESVVQRDTAPAPSGRGELILLCEDNRLVLDVTRRMLTARGFSVLAAGSGAEALQCAEAADRPIDLLLTDVRMPGMDGRELAGRLKTKYPALRVLLMSGFDSRFLQAGANADGTEYPLIQKPFKMADLVRRISALLQA